MWSANGLRGETRVDVETALRAPVGELAHPAVGEQWAYRANARSSMEHVVVTALGTKKPPRVKIHFVDESAEGREEWVPPGRLKVRWEDVEAWQARERRWDAVRVASADADEATTWAARSVYGAAGPEEAIKVGWNSDEGVLIVHDPQTAASPARGGRWRVLGPCHRVHRGRRHRPRAQR